MRQWVHPIERLYDGTLEGHGDGEPMQLQPTRKGQEIRQFAGLARQEDGVHMLGLKSGVLHGRRKGQ